MILTRKSLLCLLLNGWLWHAVASVDDHGGGTNYVRSMAMNLRKTRKMKKAQKASVRQQTMLAAPLRGASSEGSAMMRRRPSSSSDSTMGMISRKDMRMISSMTLTQKQRRRAQRIARYSDPSQDGGRQGFGFYSGKDGKDSVSNSRSDYEDCLLSKADRNSRAAFFKKKLKKKKKKSKSKSKSKFNFKSKKSKSKSKSARARSFSKSKAKGRSFSSSRRRECRSSRSGYPRLRNYVNDLNKRVDVFFDSTDSADGKTLQWPHAIHANAQKLAREDAQHQ